MRVIAGALRGKKLKAPRNEAIRPTTDRVKESLFNLIADEIDESAVVYDLFSGTGGLGIEALSRGAGYAYFCDKSKEGYELTKENIRSCHMEEKSVIIYGDYKKALKQFDEKADIVFLDPPYGAYLWKPCLEALLSQDKLKKNGIAVLERGTDQLLEDLPPDLICEKERRYGASTISIYRRRENE